MKFTEWKLMKESNMTQIQRDNPTAEMPKVELPDPRQQAYLGCVLHRIAQQTLIDTVNRWAFSVNGVGMPRQGWLGKAHHMTCKFKPMQADIETCANTFGKQIELTVVGWAMDDHCIAVVVDGTPVPPLMQGLPHITVAHSHEVSPVYSNTLLADKSKWLRMPTSMGPLMSFFLAVAHNQSVTFPVMPDPLASPSYSL